MFAIFARCLIPMASDNLARATCRMPRGERGGDGKARGEDDLYWCSTGTYGLINKESKIK